MRSVKMQTEKMSVRLYDAQAISSYIFKIPHIDNIRKI